MRNEPLFLQHELEQRLVGIDISVFDPLVKPGIISQLSLIRLV